MLEEININSKFCLSVFPLFRFATKESAAHAIVATHNTEVAGHTVKCSWGKESGDPNNIHTNAQVAMQVSKSKKYEVGESNVNSGDIKSSSDFIMPRHLST